MRANKGWQRKWVQISQSPSRYYFWAHVKNKGKVRKVKKVQSALAIRDGSGAEILYLKLF